MQTIRYPREQMHRIAYTKLTERRQLIKRGGVWHFASVELRT